MEILGKIFEVVNNKISLPVALVAVILLFLPLDIKQSMGVEEFVNSNKSLLWIILLFSSILYIYEKTKKLIEYIKNKRHIKNKSTLSLKVVKENLEGLSPQEEAWIFYCLHNNKRTVIATSIDSTAVSLEGKGILSRPYGTHDILSTPYTIHNDVWKYLTSNKNKFCPKSKINNAIYNNEVNSFMRSVRSVI